MEKEKNKNKGLIVLVLILCLIILGLVGHIVYNNFYNLKNNNTENDDKKQNDSSNINNDITNENDMHNEDDYEFISAADIKWNIDEEAKKHITLEDVSLAADVSTKKVKFIDIDDSITNKFYKDQQTVIDNIQYFKGGVEYHVKASVSNNILSILYLLEEKSAAGVCGTKMAVINIDLKNKQVVTQEELLAKTDTSYKKLAETYYEKEKNSWDEDDDYEDDLEYYGFTLENFKADKDKYINMGVEKLPGIIYVYIEDGKIKYTYYSINLMTLFRKVGKGGCFNWATEVLGDLK